MTIKGWKSKKVIFALLNITCVCLQAFGMVFLSGCKAPASRTQSGTVVSVQDRKAQLQKSLDRRFQNPQAHYEIGRIYQSEGQTAQAEQHYNWALSFDPVYRQAQAAMVQLWIESKDAAKAQQYSNIYLQQVSASADQSLELALAYQELQLDDYAMACYNKALELAANSAKVHRQLGFYYLSKNETDKAKDHLVQSFQFNSNQPDVAGELGKLGVEVKIPQKTTTTR